MIDRRHFNNWLATVVAAGNGYHYYGTVTKPFVKSAEVN